MNILQILSLMFSAIVLGWIIYQLHKNKVLWWVVSAFLTAILINLAIALLLIAFGII